MPEFFLELFSEEIPARMQARAADDLLRLVTEALAPLSPCGGRGFHGPRRIAMVLEIAGAVAAATSTERGPRVAAPEQALAGFLRKHGAAREQLRQEGDFWVLDRSSAAVSPAELIAGVMPGLLRRFPWPKSMRWGGTSAFTWVRPLRRILCLVDGQVVPFDLRDGDDDGHGLVASNMTEGHRFHAPGPVAVDSCAEWQAVLRARRALVDVDDRKRVIADAVAKLAAERGATVVDDPGLLEEVAGLVEWPVVMVGRIDSAFMDLPPEVMQVSMRVNQRYFSLRNMDGSAAPYFAFVANIEASDGGAAIVAGNERVLRARFADARHFWDLDRKTRLEVLLPKLNGMTFHAKLGSQGARMGRLMRLADQIAPLVNADVSLAIRAAELCKADLLTGMVGEFPELQGIMGCYYARNDEEDDLVSEAIRDHYAPKGQGDPIPTTLVSTTVALADKLDQLAAFFSIGEKPTGSGDPYALRRAALGIIRIIRENRIRLELGPILDLAIEAANRDSRAVLQANRRLGGGATITLKESLAPDRQPIDQLAIEIIQFVAERLRVQLQSEGARHDVLSAIFAAAKDDDLTRLLSRTGAVSDFLGSADGPSLLAAYRRADKILQIEDKRDGPHEGQVNVIALIVDDEKVLYSQFISAMFAVDQCLLNEDYSGAMTQMAGLRAPLDAFFTNVTVNDPEPQIRQNRLRLLSGVRATMNKIADFSKIEG